MVTLLVKRFDCVDDILNANLVADQVKQVFLEAAVQRGYRKSGAVSDVFMSKNVAGVGELKLRANITSAGNLTVNAVQWLNQDRSRMQAVAWSAECLFNSADDVDDFLTQVEELVAQQ